MQKLNLDLNNWKKKKKPDYKPTSLDKVIVRKLSRRAKSKYSKIFLKRIASFKKGLNKLKKKSKINYSRELKVNIITDSPENVKRIIKKYRDRFMLSKTPYISISPDSTEEFIRSKKLKARKKKRRPSLRKDNYRNRRNLIELRPDLE